MDGKSNLNTETHLGFGWIWRRGKLARVDFRREINEKEDDEGYNGVGEEGEATRDC